MRWILSLLLLASFSHSASAVAANQNALALSQASCDHCQMMLAEEAVDYLPLLSAAGFDPVVANVEPTVKRRPSVHHSARVLATQSGYCVSKVRLHLLHCVMRD